MADRDILTRVFISYRLMTEPCRADAREEARMRQKEGPGDLGKREDERRKGWGRREWKTETARKCWKGRD